LSNAPPVSPVCKASRADCSNVATADNAPICLFDTAKGSGLPCAGKHKYFHVSASFILLNFGRSLMPLGVTESILELVGRTPLLHLSRFARPPLADIYAKLEYMNPGRSVKDRAALGMILDAERRGALKPGATIIEPTAGNTGIGLALIGVARGYHVILCVPEGYS